jgi:hypothetical protein
MGELADRLKNYLDEIRRKPALLGRDLFIDAENKILADVADLEAKLETCLKRNAELAEIAESLLAVSSEPQFDIDHQTWYQPTIPRRVVELRERLLNPRSETDYIHVRDRDAALAALTAIVGRGYRVLAVTEASTNANPIDGDTVTIKLNVDGLPKIEGLRVAVLAPSTSHNPELIERASTLLMEQYIDAKAKEPK